MHLYPGSPGQTSNRQSLIRSFLRRGWTAVCITAYIAHVSYLSLAQRFDYGYNILANLVIGVTHNILWVLYSIPATPFERFPFTDNSTAISSSGKSSSRSRWVPKPLWCVLLTTAATMLELFDFPPWFRIIDAHSLWHLATAPIAGLWYSFLVEDSRDDGWVWHKLR